ncbi:hypothetical protein [Biformimicrobium ophioploci]|uniref:Uncharacterized protein n=1 Tax=Biformimicrobium ophioploci TaxID=3036711 RepID=A0ABQ6M2U5_9GAMM|nr:hypothetical protein [Microbulbifer sp. NKW57]GMG88679.1 hypothetical protein MNKW57_30000 [Microbulbifer sp. NKW57]
MPELSLQLLDHPNPEACLDSQLTAGGAEPFELAVRFAHEQFYLDPRASIDLLALFWREQAGEGVCFSVVQAAAASALTSKGCRGLAEAMGAPLLRLDGPMPLQPVYVEKPWGREVWFSGIEARGQSLVGTPGATVPLPWVLQALPQRCAAGTPEKINLLKILDPLPEPVFGDLYFEMHEEKQEVYIVTHVAEEAWPDGTGAIRYGFCPQKRAAFDSFADFLAAYRSAVAAYEKCRREIDAILDHKRAAAGIAADAPLDAATTKAWLAEIPEALLVEEADLRAAMDAFTALRPLRVGDVVTVPTHTPHALQHGVRTVEFQTPVYERKILSFAQKVLTQGHWDTDAALGLVAETPLPQPAFEQLPAPESASIERIVDFSDFCVDRIRVSTGGSVDLPACEDYRVGMVVGASMRVNGAIVDAESAFLLPAGSALRVQSDSADAALLLAEPRGQ